MNIFKKTTLYFSLITSLIIPVLFLVPTHHASAAGCAKINNAYFESVTTNSPVTKDGVLTFNYATTANPQLKVVVDTQNCSGLPIKVQVIEIGTVYDAPVSILTDPSYIVPASNKLEFIVKPSEEICKNITGNGCRYKITVSTANADLVGSSYTTIYDSTTYAVTSATKGYRLEYACKGGACDDDGVWKLISSTGIRVSDTCVISDGDFLTNIGPTPLHLRQVSNPGLELRLKTTGCIGWVGKLSLNGGSITFGKDKIKERSFVFDKTTAGITRIPLTPGETDCGIYYPNCSVYMADITPISGGNTGTEFSMKTETKTQYRLHYNCIKKGACSDTFLWEIGGPDDLGDINKKTVVGPALPKTGCSVTSASFDTWTTPDGYAEYELKHLETHGWFWEDHRDFINPITVSVQTKNCAGGYIYVDVAGYDTVNKLYVAVMATRDRAFLVPSNEAFDIKLIAGEDACTGGAGNKPDCSYTIHAYTQDTEGKKSEIYTSDNKTHGNLNYKCDTLCGSAEWKYAGDTSAAPYPSDEINAEPPTDLVDDGSASSISPECLDKETGKAIDGCYQLYGGLAEVLKGKFDNINSLGGFINAIIALAIGIAGIITVGMIMFDGFTYWRAGKEGNEVALGVVKGRIWKRLLGLLLLFTIYTILRTINPDLLNLTPRINVAELSSASQSTLSSNDYTAITGELLKSPSEYDALAKQIATTYSSDYCALRVIIQNESRGNPNVVGQDENVRNAGIPSRVAFINSAKKYSGATFTTSSDLITQKGFCNDAAGCNQGVPKPTSPTLGLDWRFSKGIGLTQITFFPNDYKDFKTPGYVPFYDNKNVPPKRTFNFSSGAMTVTAVEAFKPEKNLELSAKLWKQGMATCSNSPQGAFYTYACGSCDCSNNSFAKTEVSERVSQYNECKKQNP